MNIWSASFINKRKSSLKREIESSFPSNSPERLQFLLSRIRQLEELDDPASRLDRYIFLMSALVQHERTGGLSATQVEKLVDLGYALLQYQQIKPSKSHVSFLYGELHLVRAQIYRNEGMHWRAAWEQQLGQHLSRNAPLGGDSFQHLALALRALRLGYLNVAQEELDQVDSSHPSVDLGQLAIARARILRLSQQWQSLAIFQQELDSSRLNPVAKLEWQWERLVAESCINKDHSGLFYAVRRKGSHYLASYIVEAKLWAFSHQRRTLIPLVPKMSTIARVEKLKPQRLGFIFNAARILEDAYNPNIPLTARLKTVGDMVAQAHLVTTVDKELLIWCATARWLSRVQSFTLAKLALTEYTSLSLRLTAGASADVLNLVEDMQKKRWS